MNELQKAKKYLNALFFAFIYHFGIKIAKNSTLNKREGGGGLIISSATVGGGQGGEYSRGNERNRDDRFGA